MVQPTHHMILVLPNRAPHRAIVKATIENPGHVLALSQWLDDLAHRRQRLLHFRRFTDKASFLVTSEAMREDAPPSRRFDLLLPFFPFFLILSPLLTVMTGCHNTIS